METESRRLSALFDKINKNVFILELAVEDMLTRLLPKANFHQIDTTLFKNTLYKSKDSGNFEQYLPQTTKFLSDNFDYLTDDDKILVLIGWEGLWGEGTPPLKVTEWENSILFAHTQNKLICPDYVNLSLDLLISLKTIDTDEF